MKISYDSQADAMYIHLQDGAFSANKEIEEGIILDIGANHTLLGIELLDASKRISTENLEKLTKQSK